MLEDKRRSQTEPILGWCCSLGAQPGASREFLLAHRAQVCSPGLPHPPPRAGTPCTGHRSHPPAPPGQVCSPCCVQGRQEQGSHTIPRGLGGPSRRTDSCFSSPSLTFQENPSYKGDVAEPKAAPTVSRTAAAAAPTTPAVSQGLKAEKCPKTEPSEGTTAEFIPLCQPSIPALHLEQCPTMRGPCQTSQRGPSACWLPRPQGNAWWKRELDVQGGFSVLLVRFGSGGAW